MVVDTNPPAVPVQPSGTSPGAPAVAPDARRLRSPRCAPAIGGATGVCNAAWEGRLGERLVHLMMIKQSKMVADGFLMVG